MAELKLNADEITVCKFLNSSLFNVDATEIEIPRNIPLRFLISNKALLTFYDIAKKKNLEFDSKYINLAEETDKKFKKLIEEFVKVANHFYAHDVKFMVIKYPHWRRELSDIDILIINDEKIKTVRRILKSLGYFEGSTEKYELYKSTYTKLEDDTFVTMHIHREISWRGVIYLSNDEVWNNKRKDNIGIVEVYMPSFEDDLSITAAHTLFENHQITLYDVLHACNLLKKVNMNQVLSSVFENGYSTPFRHFIYTAKMMYESLYETVFDVSIRKPISLIFEREKIILPFRYSKLSLIFFGLYKSASDLRMLKLKNCFKDLHAYFIYPITSRLMPKRTKIVTIFSGMDGTGKSTHAKALKEKFEKLGIPCEIVWTRWRPVITYPIMGLIYVLKRWRRKDYHKSKILRKIWAYLTILDFAYFHLFKVKPSLFKGKVVICDRYIYDHIADLMHDGLYNENAVKFLLKLIPNPNLSLIFDVPVSTAMVRKPDTQEILNLWRFEESAEEYLNEQRGNYLKVAKKFGIEVIDSTTDFKELNDIIFDEIIRKYNQ